MAAESEEKKNSDKKGFNLPGRRLKFLQTEDRFFR
jgi:hypothetical protein